MNRQDAFEQHWADMHDLPVETLAQYRWKDRDGYNLPGIAAGYRNYCAGWDAAMTVGGKSFDIPEFLYPKKIEIPSEGERP